MKPSSVAVAAGVTRYWPLDNNVVPFNVAIRTTATVLTTVDPLPTTPPTAPGGAALWAALNWTAAPAAVDGVITLTSPRSAISLASAGATVASVLQQGLR